MRSVLATTIFSLCALALLCSALLASDAARLLKDGSYKGSANGYIGPIEVEVIVKNSKIASVKILSHSEDAPRTALVEIPKRIVGAQSAEVDAVTGATYTSKGVRNAVKAALKDAQPPMPKSEKKDLAGK